jgi:hypothetical protein
MRLGTQDQFIDSLRDCLIREFVGSGQSTPGNEDFRNSLLNIIRGISSDPKPSGYQSVPAFWNIALLMNPDQETSLSAAHAAISKESWQSLNGMTGWKMAQDKGGSAGIRRIQQYLVEIVQIAAEFGLSPTKQGTYWWTYDWLHDQVKKNVVGLQLGESQALIDKRIWIGKTRNHILPDKRLSLHHEWTMDQWSDKNVTRQDILDEFERLWNDGEDYLKGEGYTIYRRRELLRHVRWLYLRVCPQSDIGRPYGWKKIADAEHAAIRTVSEPVKSMALLLELELPTIPRGRPKKP